MSVIKVNKIEHTGTTAGGVEVDSSGHVTVDGVQMPTAGALSHRNLVVNGGMTVSQRGTSFSFAHDGTTAAYTIDHMHFTAANFESFDCTVSQSTDAPEGFAKSWKLATGTAEASIDADDLAYFQTVFEAQDLQQLNYGSSSAQTVTLSFYVKSSVTGTYGCTVYQADGNRNRTATYTINTADTWERKEITFTGDTAGTINDDNGLGLNIAWNLAAGSNWDATDSTSWGAYVNSRWAFGHAQDGVITTASATWQITGIQLEVGSKATPFEHRSFGDELHRCKRYFEKRSFDTNTYEPICVGTVPGTSSNSTLKGIVYYEVVKRVAPTITSSAASTFRRNGAGIADAQATGLTINQISDMAHQLEVVQNNQTSGYSGWISRQDASTTFINYDAEL